MDTTTRYWEHKAICAMLGRELYEAARQLSADTMVPWGKADGKTRDKFVEIQARALEAVRFGQEA